MVFDKFPILILQLLFVIERRLSNSASTGLIEFLCISARAAMYGKPMDIEFEDVRSVGRLEMIQLVARLVWIMSVLEVS